MTMIKTINKNIAVLIGTLCMMCTMMVGCSDEPDSENYYTFKGEMMSTYLQTRDQYSLFASIVTRAGLMDLLSAYGAYTCFAPDNDAVNRYLSERGYSSIDQLSKADCDTIARTHLMDVMYTTFDMPDGVLTTPNMNSRYLEVSRKLDNDSNAVVFLNDDAHIYYELQDDSVENGIVQPIDRVLQSSNRMLPDIIRQNPNISLFSEALRLTGLSDSLYRYKDESYHQPLNTNGQPEWHDYNTGGDAANPIREAARAPKERLLGYTAFIVPDAVLSDRYGIHDIEGLYRKACEVYDPMYGGQNEAWHSLENATDRRNPLNRLIAYHLLNRNVHGYNLLTVLEDIGIDTQKMNPTEWYGTLMPHTMMKVEKLTVRKFQGQGILTDRYINRRYDNQYQLEGVHIQPTIGDGYRGEALNGCYFYVDELIVYDNKVINEVMNCRMRMDLSAVFPELMTNNMRMNYKGNGLYSDDARYSHEELLGTCYFFPNGYLDGVTVGNNGYFVYRRPRYGYWSYSGDEFVCNGDFDLSFRIPPVPTEGDYQIRLGYAAMSIRGIAQVYFDGEPQGIPLDMRRDLRDESLLGNAYWGSHDNEYNTTMTEDEKLEERKDLKNKGFYRGANGAFRKGSASDAGQYFAEIYATLRIVLFTVHIKPGENHYLRFRCVSEGLGNNEIMLDYLELVPKSVYGVTDEGVQEDDL